MSVCVAAPVPVLALMHGLIVNDMYGKTHSYHMLVYILCKQTNTLLVRSLARSLRSFIHSFTTFIHAQNKQNKTEQNKTKQYHIINLSCVYSFIHSYSAPHTSTHTFAYTLFSTKINTVILRFSKSFTPGP